jgi:hypothetical protein
MSKRKKEHVIRHVRICHYMMDTPAWKSLNCIARAMYVDIASKYAGPDSNNGKIVYSVRMAKERLNIGQSTAGRTLEILQERGFIVCMSKGGFNRKGRHASEWRLTEFGCNVTGELATKEFTRWGKTDNVIAAADRWLERGRQA